MDSVYHTYPVDMRSTARLKNLFNDERPVNLAIVHKYLQMIQARPGFRHPDRFLKHAAYAGPLPAPYHPALCIKDPEYDIQAVVHFKSYIECAPVRVGIDVQTPDGAWILHGFHPEFQFP